MASRHADWLRQADADLRLSRHARDGAAHDWACFAAQQAAEKALNPNGLDAGGVDLLTLPDGARKSPPMRRRRSGSGGRLDRNDAPTAPSPPAER